MKRQSKPLNEVTIKIPDQTAHYIAMNQSDIKRVGTQGTSARQHHKTIPLCNVVKKTLVHDSVGWPLKSVLLIVALFTTKEFALRPKIKKKASIWNDKFIADYFRSLYFN